MKYVNPETTNAPTRSSVLSFSLYLLPSLARAGVRRNYPAARSPDTVGTGHTPVPSASAAAAGFVPFAAAAAAAVDTVAPAVDVAASAAPADADGVVAAGAETVGRVGLVAPVAMDGPCYGNSVDPSEAMEVSHT